MRLLFAHILVLQHAVRNNEFKYGLQGLLMAIGFFVVIKIIYFIISISPNSPTAISVIDSDLQVNQPGNLYSAKGKTWFAQNCASCHSIHKRLTGPALADIESRVPNKNLLCNWIRNSQKVIESDYKYFNALYKSYGKIQMNHFPNLTNSDIDSILDYINHY